MRRAVAATRQAISPRLAMSKVSNTAIPSLHAEDAEAGGFDRSVQSGGKRKGEYASGVAGADNAVVPETRRGVVGVPFVLVLLADRRLEGFLFLGAPAAAATFNAVAPHRREHAGRLFAPHDGDAGIRPEVKHARAKGASAHAVVSSAEGAADDDGELRHRGRGNRRHHLGSMAGDAFVFVLAADHEAGDVLQEDERDPTLAAQFNEVSAFLRRFGKQDAVV